MRRNHARHHQVAHLFAVGALTLTEPWCHPASAQIFLSPNQQYPQRPRFTLDVGGGVRCSVEGGASPSLSFSVGAYPDLIFDNVVVNSTSSSAGQQSQLFALASINIPLNQKVNNFSCDQLLQDVQLRTRLQSLRELADENIISESQYRKAVMEAFKKFMGAEIPPLPPLDDGRPKLVIPPTAKPAAG
jgi:hypothetical protein